MIFNHTAFKQITPPAYEPLSRALAKAHLRITDTLSDSLIDIYIAAAREYVEDYTGHCLVTQTWRYSLDQFPLLPNSQYAPGNPNIVQPAVNNVWPLDPSMWAIFVPRSPIQSVASIVYADTQTTTKTLDPSTYVVDSDSEPPRLTTAVSSFWPSAVFNPNAVQITLMAGYADPQVIVTGTAAAGTFTQVGSYNGYPQFSSGSYQLWFNNSNWIISTAVGSNGSAYWSGSVNISPQGSFTPGGSASGTASCGAVISALPTRAIQAMLLLVSHYFEHREAVWAGPGSTPVEVPMAVESLLQPLRVTWVWA